MLWTVANLWLFTGFQERSDAFDFNVALQEYTRSVPFEHAKENDGDCTEISPYRRRNAVPAASESLSSKSNEPKQDFSLKEGQTFSINLGGKSSKPRPKPASSSSSGGLGSSSGGFPLIPPPPSANSVRKGL